MSRNCLRSDELSAIQSVASTTNSNESEAKEEPSSRGTPYLARVRVGVRVRVEVRVRVGVRVRG